MRNLNVCLITRERTSLTEKTIESLLINNKLFDNINIFCFDNLSDLTKERTELFKNLLISNKIKYYSYDTNLTLNNYFPKVVLFNRFIELMNKIKDKNENYYLLSDNDMIYLKNYDSYFLDLIYHIQKNKLDEKIHYLCVFPGGIKAINKEDKTNTFNNEEYRIIYGRCGGSGCWFMNHKMLNKLKWEERHYKLIHNKFKGHDFITWNYIINKKILSYVGGIKSDYPLVLHLGGIFGSLCNKLNNKEEIKDIVNKDDILKNISIDEIEKLYKNDKTTKW